MPRTAAPELVPLAAACKRLGISDDTFRRRWADVFTDFRTPGGHRRVCSGELAEAMSRPDFPRQRAAVLRVRGLLGRT